MLLSCGIWPALPLTGYWVLARLRSPGCRPWPPSTHFALATALGLALWSLPLLITLILGIYKGMYLGLAGWVVTVVAAYRLVRTPRIRPKAVKKPSMAHMVLGVGLAVAAVLYLGYSAERMLGERDDVVYANHAIYMAHHGRLDVPYPWPEEAESLFSRAYAAPPGFYETQPTLTVQFGHLFPAWLAQAFSSFGQNGLFRLNGVIMILSLLVLYGLFRLLLSPPFAVTATLFIAFNPSTLWIARVTLTEPLAQLLLLSGILLFLHSLRLGHLPAARWAGVCFGVAALVRIDTLFLVPLLFAGHLVWLLLEPDGPRPRVWAALYQTTLPALAVALGYYARYSRPYFEWLSPQLLPIGALAVCSLAALLAVAFTPLRLYARDWATSRVTLAVLGVVLLSLAAYAYWIRPHDPPYSTFDWPGTVLHGQRTHNEDALVNLARYLSPPVVWTAILGCIGAMWALVGRHDGRDVQSNAPTGYAAGLIIVVGYAGLYLWDQSASPHHYWAIRRFVPIIIPGFVLFAALVVCWLSGKLPRVVRLGALSLVLVFLAGHTIAVDRHVYAVTEYKDSYDQVARLAGKLPKGELILAGPRELPLMPLYTAFDRRVIFLELGTDAGRRALAEWVDRQARQGRPVYLLRQGRPPRGLAYSKLDTVVLTWSFNERTVKPLPRKITRQQAVVDLYIITGKPTTGRSSSYGAGGARP